MLWFKIFAESLNHIVHGLSTHLARHGSLGWGRGGVGPQDSLGPRLPVARVRALALQSDTTEMMRAVSGTRRHLSIELSSHFKTGLTTNECCSGVSCWVGMGCSGTGSGSSGALFSVVLVITPSRRMAVRTMFRFPLDQAGAALYKRLRQVHVQGCKPQEGALLAGSTSRLLARSMTRLLDNCCHHAATAILE